MKIGFLQFCPRFGEKDYNLQQVEKMIQRADADLMVLPELFNSGYLFLSAEEAASAAEPIPDGPTSQMLMRLARERDMCIVAGLAEEADGELYNSAVLVTPGGEAITYRKIHLFMDEKKFFRSGDQDFPVVDVGQARLGLMVCFDWIFPEPARVLALKGADIICHPANLVLPFCQRAMITRCLENGVFAITANRTGTETRDGKSLTYSGLSQVTGPRGEVLSSAGEDEEVIGVVEVDPLKARDKKVTELNDLMLDRKPELYGEITGCSRQ